MSFGRNLEGGKNKFSARIAKWSKNFIGSHYSGVYLKLNIACKMTCRRTRKR